MKKFKSLIGYCALIIISILIINFYLSNKGFLTVEISNLKAKAFEIEKILELK